jgi:hypothetical protein
MVFVPPDTRIAPLFPAFVHYMAQHEAGSARRRSKSFSGYLPYVLKDFYDDLARCHEFGPTACTDTASSENDGASEVDVGRVDDEKAPADDVQSRQRSYARIRQTVGAPTTVRNTEKKHEENKAKEMFESSLSRVKESDVKIATPPMLLSQKITSATMKDCGAPLDEEGSPNKKQHSPHIHPKFKGVAWQEITTIMVRNLPFELTQKALLQELDRSGFEDLYDLVYLPHDFARKRNLGIAFVNFTTATAAQSLIDQWHGGNREFTHNVYAEGLNLKPSNVQGADANLKQWLGSNGKRIRNPKFRPYVAAQHRNKWQISTGDCWGKERDNK